MDYNYLTENDEPRCARCKKKIKPSYQAMGVSNYCGACSLKIMR